MPDALNTHRKRVVFVLINSHSKKSYRQPRAGEASGTAPALAIKVAV